MKKPCWVKPQRLLAPIKHVPLPTFYDMVGGEVFGKTWKRSTQLSNSSNGEKDISTGTDEIGAMADLVMDQILLVLGSGKIKAELRLHEPQQSSEITTALQKWDHDCQLREHRKALRKLRSNGNRKKLKASDADFVQDPPTEDDNEPDDELGELGIYKYQPGRHFNPKVYDCQLRPLISREYWKNYKSVPTMTAESIVAIPTSCLVLDALSGSPFDEIELAGKGIGHPNLKGYIWIRNPVQGLQDAFDWPQADLLEGWGKQYLDYRKIFWPEIVAVVWRLIAIRKLTGKHGCIEEISAAVESYASASERPLGPSLKVSAKHLREVVSEIVSQLRNGNKSLKSPVIPKLKRF